MQGNVEDWRLWHQTEGFENASVTIYKRSGQEGFFIARHNYLPWREHLVDVEIVEA
jgi:hypothetical protein